MNLAGKNVVITGASSGIGKATALEMARRGANVVLAARRTERLEQLAAECSRSGVRAVAVATDVTRRDDCAHLLQTAGMVDVLVNNAGFAILDRIEDASADDLRAMMETNYFGTVHCTQAALPGMLARGSGTIVNVASITGIMGFAGMGGYCATKFAIIGFTEALRNEVLDRGLKVALVCPATTRTEFFDTAEPHKIPRASRLLPTLPAEAVARAICDAAEDGSYRRILPLGAALYMRFKEWFPRLAHSIMRITSSLLERRS